MSHPDPLAPPDTRPIEVGEVWENPATLERAVIVDPPWLNAEGSAVAELTAVPGTRVVGEHMHPALVERFSVEDGEPCVLHLERGPVVRARQVFCATHTTMNRAFIQTKVAARCAA